MTKIKIPTNPKFGLLTVIREDFVNLGSKITNRNNDETSNTSYNTTFQYLPSTEQLSLCRGMQSLTLSNFLYQLSIFSSNQLQNVSCHNYNHSTKLYSKGKKVKERTAVNGTPSHSYGVSLVIWDHTLLPATRHK